jgi:spore germination protein KC
MILSLSGCWSRIEPKYLGVVNSIIYDVDDEGKYIIHLEFLNAADAGNGQEGKSKGSNFTVEAMGDSPREAIANVSQSVDRSIFGGHNKVRFFSERLARGDVTSTLDYILRAKLTDETALIGVIKGDEPEKIYKATLNLSDTVGSYIKNISRFLPDSTSKSAFPTTLDFVKDYYSDGKQPVAGVIEVVETESKSPKGEEMGGEGEKEHKIICEGLAAFKDGVLAGYMNGEETRAYNFIVNKVRNIHITVPSDTGNTVFVVSGSKCKVKTSKEDDKIKIEVKLKVSSGVTAETGEIEINDPKEIKKLEEAFNEKLKKDIEGAIKKAQQEFKSDIFGFGEFMHDQHPKEWRELKKDWDEAFSKAEVSVSVESRIRRYGEIKRPFRYEEEDK